MRHTLCEQCSNAVQQQHETHQMYNDIDHFSWFCYFSLRERVRAHGVCAGLSMVFIYRDRDSNFQGNKKSIFFACHTQYTHAYVCMFGFFLHFIDLYAAHLAVRSCVLRYYCVIVNSFKYFWHVIFVFLFHFFCSLSQDICVLVCMRACMGPKSKSTKVNSIQFKWTIPKIIANCFKAINLLLFYSCRHPAALSQCAAARRALTIPCLRDLIASNWTRKKETRSREEIDGERVSERLFDLKMLFNTTWWCVIYADFLTISPALPRSVNICTWYKIVCSPGFFLAFSSNIR